MKTTDKKAAIGSMSSTTALTMPRELPRKYPIKRKINDNEYLLHGLLAQILSV